LPTIVSKYVRPGKVRIVFNGMSFVGPDSETALRTALAAGEQNRLWNVVALLYLNQGTENTGWVTDSLLRGIGKAIPGLDTKKMFASLHSATVTQKLAAAAALAQEAGVNQTPTFAVGPTNKALTLIQINSLEPSGIEPALDAALRE
jgi:protein-disulfide isomerase